MLNKLISILFIASLAGCGDGSSSDPATASRDDLNGPKNLRSIAVQDGSDVSVTLIWNTFNAEEELKGYHVFGTELGDQTLTEFASKVTYPASFSAAQILSASFPRCKDNSAFFEAFGLPTTEGDCESAEEDETKTSTDTDNSGYTLSADEKEGPLKAKLDCDGEDSTNVSLPTSGIQLGTVKCVVKNLKNSAGENVALEAGKSYLFFVAAVSGDEFEDVSWISNTVKDTPSTKVYSDTVSVETGATAATSKFQRLYFDFTDTLAIKKDTAASCIDSVCKLTGKNSGNDFGFYFGRDNTSSDNRERIFFSVPATGNTSSLATDGEMGVQYKRTAISREFANSETLSSIGVDGFHPGDTAGSVYVFDGTHFPIYGDQIFDFQVRKDSATHYGKIIITDWKIADKADVAAESAIDVRSAVSFTTTVVLQTQAESTDYWSN